MAKLAINDGNQQALKWAEWYRSSPAVSRPVREAITNPVVINEYMHGARPQLSDNPTEQQKALRMLEHLRSIRGEDAASFDAMLGGVSQRPGLVRVFIDHENGRRYERGLKLISEMTPLEKLSGGHPMSQRERQHLACRHA